MQSEPKEKPNISLQDRVKASVGIGAVAFNLGMYAINPPKLEAALPDSDYAAQTDPQERDTNFVDRLARSVWKFIRGKKLSEKIEKESKTGSRVLDFEDYQNQDKPKQESRVREFPEPKPRQLTKEELFHKNAEVYSNFDERMGFSRQEVEDINDHVYDYKVDLGKQGVPGFIADHYVKAEHLLTRADMIANALYESFRIETDLDPKSEIPITKSLFDEYTGLYKNANEEITKARENAKTAIDTPASSEEGIVNKVKSMAILHKEFEDSFDTEISHHYAVVTIATDLFVKTRNDYFRKMVGDHCENALAAIDAMENSLTSVKEGSLNNDRIFYLARLMGAGKDINEFKKDYGKEVIKQAQREYKNAPRLK